MKNRIVVAALMAAFLAAFLGSCHASDRPTWPEYVWSSIVIPGGAQSSRYAYHADTYQITYSLEACFPPNDVIRQVAEEMKRKGWERLSNDPLNPGQKLSIAISPNGMSLTSHPWEDYWRDGAGNSVFYGYQYEIDNLPIEAYAKKLEESCSLRGVIIFSPAEVFKTIQEISHEALQEKKKAEEKKGR